MNLTPEDVAMIKRGTKGFTREKLEAWGVGWPPKKGWRKALLHELGETADEVTVPWDKTIVIPPAELEALRKGERGWNKGQLAKWGISWPPPKGLRKMLIRQAAFQHHGEGRQCPKCGAPMQRREHPPGWRPKVGQKSYFRYWDYCRPCQYIRQYEAARVTVGSPEGAS